MVRGRLVDNIEVAQIKWYYDGGTVEVLDLNAVKSLQNFIVNQDSNLRALKKAHEDNINALEDENAVKAYDVTSSVNGLSWFN